MPLLLEAVQPVPDEVARLRVEAGGRLVEQQQVGSLISDAGDGQAPLHAARQRLDQVVAPLGELDEVEQLVGPRRATSRCDRSK